MVGYLVEFKCARQAYEVRYAGIRRLRPGANNPGISDDEGRKALERNSPTYNRNAIEAKYLWVNEQIGNTVCTHRHTDTEKYDLQVCECVWGKKEVIGVHGWDRIFIQHLYL